MEDMPARNALLSSVRPPSSYLVVPVRGRGLVFALAFVLFAVALFSQIDSAGASACDRTGPQSGVQEELEVYFTEWPPHTYCLVRNSKELYPNLNADQFCSWTMTNPISMIYTPMYRICRLMRFFGIKDSRLLIEDTLQQPDIIGWEDCYFRAENETKPTVNCSSCNVSVICEDHAIYSNVSRCVTRAEGDKDVEYCYNYDKANATEATE
ncbi:hypothetical protein MTO96_025476 [Rhipicephalus appendiculatus]